MGEHPERVRRRLVPDEPQLQIILGSLLAGARIDGRAGERGVAMRHSPLLGDYVSWKYERLGALAATAPRIEGHALVLRTIAHPLFDDIVAFAGPRLERRSALRAMLGPLGVAVWMSDLGRLELRPQLFVPLRRLAPAA